MELKVGQIHVILTIFFYSSLGAERMDLAEKKQKASEIYNRLQTQARGGWSLEDAERARKKSTRVPSSEQLFKVEAFEPKSQMRIRGLEDLVNLELSNVGAPFDGPYLDVGQAQKALIKLDDSKIFQTSDGDLVRIVRLK